MASNQKSAQYAISLQQIRSITAGEPNIIANLANIVSVLKTNLGYFWIGFYLVDASRDELVLGPFQGSPACVRIARGKGVCGTAWDTGTTQVVADVHQFEGHIACDPNSKSEIVVPVCNQTGEVVMVLDLDHDKVHAFDDVDRQNLEELAVYIGTLI